MGRDKNERNYCRLSELCTNNNLRRLQDQQTRGVYFSAVACKHSLAIHTAPRLIAHGIRRKKQLRKDCTMLNNLK